MLKHGLLLISCLLLTACAIGTSENDGFPSYTPVALSATDLPMYTDTVVAPSTPKPVITTAVDNYPVYPNANQTQAVSHYVTSSPTFNATEQMMTVVSKTSTPTFESLVPPPPGLVFRIDEQYFFTNAEGEAQLLFEVQEGETLESISPDLRYTHIFALENHWIVNLETGQRTLVDVGDEYILCDIYWWPARPELMLANLHVKKDHTGYVCGGIPALLGFDGKIAYILSSTLENTLQNLFFQASPDGKYIAFVQNKEAWIYEYGVGSYPLDLNSYGFPTLTDIYISHPSWSPSGQLLAWTIMGLENGEEKRGIGIFDMKNKKARFLYPFQTEGFDGGRGSVRNWSPSEENLIYFEALTHIYWLIATDGTTAKPIESLAMWSSDGKWYAQTPNKSGNIILINSSDGKKMNEVSINTLSSCDFSVIGWSPDSSHLAIEGNPPSSACSNWLINVQNWNVYKIDLPYNARILIWAPLNE